jgi:hypothetical protein
MMDRKRFLAVVGWILPVAASVCLAPAQVSPKNSADLVVLLEKSGHKYSKVDDGVWEIMYEGKNMKSIPVRVTMAENILVTLAKLADRKDLTLDPVLLVKLLELNNDFDYVKLALTKSMLYVRMDSPLRLLDAAELNHVLEQVSAAVPGGRQVTPAAGYSCRKASSGFVRAARRAGSQQATTPAASNTPVTTA